MGKPHRRTHARQPCLWVGLSPLYPLAAGDICPESRGGSGKVWKSLGMCLYYYVWTMSAKYNYYVKCNISWNQVWIRDVSQGVWVHESVWMSNMGMPSTKYMRQLTIGSAGRGNIAEAFPKCFGGDCGTCLDLCCRNDNIEQVGDTSSHSFSKEKNVYK